MVSMESGRGKVVIVEDDTQMASLYEVWLEEEYSVQIAPDCETAYELVGETVDVVLLDRQLPDGTGDDVLTHIQESGYDCPVAMVTAVEPEFDIVEMGFDDYLRKPMEREELQNVVERLLAQSEYGEDVQRLYSLATKKAMLESSYSDGRLEESEEYARLESEMAALNQSLVEKTLSFSETQVHAEIRRL